MTVVDIEALRALEKVATPGPWFNGPNLWACITTKPGGLGSTIAMLPRPDLNATIIVAIRNALPELLDELESEREHADRLVASILDDIADVDEPTKISESTRLLLDDHRKRREVKS